MEIGEVSFADQCSFGCELEREGWGRRGNIIMDVKCISFVLTKNIVKLCNSDGVVRNFWGEGGTLVRLRPGNMKVESLGLLDNEIRSSSSYS